MKTASERGIIARMHGWSTALLTVQYEVMIIRCKNGNCKMMWILWNGEIFAGAPPLPDNYPHL